MRLSTLSFRTELFHWTLGLSLLLLGRMVWREGTEENRLFGAVAIAGGFGTLAVRCRVYFRRWQHAETVRQKKERRASMRKERQERTERERSERQQEQETKQQTAARQRALRNAQSHQAQQQQTAQTLERLLREQEIEVEAAKLRLLTDRELSTEVMRIFAQRGFQVQSAYQNIPGDFLLTGKNENQTELARCLPARRKAGVAEVEALEEARREMGAEHAYLIATEGFSPPAVRLVRHFPVTLVEPYLLAHWNTAFKD